MRRTDIVQRSRPWTIPGLEDTRPPLPESLRDEIDKIRSEPSPRREVAPMLDPSWTPAKGYGHASAILEALARADESRFGDLVQEGR